MKKSILVILMVLASGCAANKPKEDQYAQAEPAAAQQEQTATEATVEQEKSEEAEEVTPKSSKRQVCGPTMGTRLKRC